MYGVVKLESTNCVNCVGILCEILITKRVFFPPSTSRHLPVYFKSTAFILGSKIFALSQFMRKLLLEVFRRSDSAVKSDAIESSKSYPNY
jgi:hypothetical protein